LRSRAFAPYNGRIMKIRATLFLVAALSAPFLLSNPALAKSKVKHGAGCNSRSTFGNLAAAPPYYSFKGGIDRHINPAFEGILTNISKRLRMKVLVTSGYRDCARNRNTRGSAKNSAHLTGNAADIRGGKSLADAIFSQGLHKGQVLWNTCVVHVHLGIGRSGHFNECGTSGRKGSFDRKHHRKTKPRKKKGRK
jgi:hypothetical protein